MKGSKTDIKGSSVIFAIRSLMKHTSAPQKRKIILMTVLIFITAMLDVVGLASVLPLIQAGADTNAIHTNKYLQQLYLYFNFQTDNQFILFMIAVILGYFLLKTAFGIFVSWMHSRLTAEIAVYITRNQFEKYYKLDFLEFSNIKSSLIIRNILNTPSAYCQWIINPLTMIISEVIIILLIVTAISVYDPFMFVFMIITIAPATVIVYRALRKRGAVKGRAVDGVFPYALSTLTESITGYIDIKLAGKEKEYQSRFLRHMKNTHELHQSINLLNQIPLRTNEVIALLGIILLFVYALFLAGNKGDLIIMVGAFAAAAYRLMPSMNRILNSMMYVNNNVVTIQNLDAFSNLPASEAASEKPEPVHFTKSIAFDHIAFRFPRTGNQIFSDLDFEIKKGENVGFIGESGSGKTTLMKLLLRFYKENSGNILIDGQPLRNEQVENWRKLIGYVKQDIFLIDGSIEENITLGDPEVDQVWLRKVIHQASLDRFIDSLPEGIHTQIGEKGGSLSGGQRQRIGIARSLYRNAEILVFDEATSALDNTTENEVTEAIDELSKTKKTILTIAHRITTLRNCNRIYEIKDGRVAGIHNYKELVEKMIY